MSKQIYGWAGKILRVDLTQQKISLEPTMKYAGRFVGGRGIQQWILFNEVAPDTGPLDPRNLLIFGTGPLTATDAPASTFTAISSKNVLSGGTNFAHVGGHFAPQLKLAGFDQIIIYGKADKPVYLWLDDGQVEFKDASHLWGKVTWETEDLIRDAHGDTKIEVACIGPAGENQVGAACIIVDKTRAAGGGGIGAVMGSKNLKAIAVRGNHPVNIADPSKFEDAVGDALAKISSLGLDESMGRWGTHGMLMKLMNKACLLPVKNVQDDHWDAEKIERIGPQGAEAFRSNERIEACFNCPIGCGDNIYEVKEGPYAGIKIRLFEANTAYSLGSRLGIDYLPAIFKAFEMVSQLGLDNDNTAVALSWAFHCYERGIITKEDTGGREFQWGDYKTVMELIDMIAYRKGFGDLLAEGAKQAAYKIGRGAEYYLTQVKGQEFVDAIRAAKGWALGIITATRAGRHLNGAPVIEYAGENLPPDVGEKVYGVATAGDPRTYEGKAKLVFWHEQLKAVVDMVGMCYNTSQWVHPGLLAPEDYARMLTAATGVEFSGEQLMLIGRRVHNIEKAINTLHRGFTREDDLPPRILMEEPVRMIYHQGY